MKKLYLLLLVFLSCQKQLVDKKLDANSVDPDTVQMQLLIRPVIASLQKAKDLKEFEKELRTLAPKMGLTLSKAREWFSNFNRIQEKLHKKFSGGSVKLQDNLASPYSDCQATAEAVFLGAVSACATGAAASGPFAPVVMSVCGSGAIVVYVVQMNACDRKFGCPCVN
jgi:hypothetical protein